MRISDWSSDVCSSDLLGHGDRHGRVALDQPRRAAVLRRPGVDPRGLLPGRAHRRRLALEGDPLHLATEDEPRAADRRAPALYGPVHYLHRALSGYRLRHRHLDPPPVDLAGARE